MEAFDLGGKKTFLAGKDIILERVGIMGKGARLSLLTLTPINHVTETSNFMSL